MKILSYNILVGGRQRLPSIIRLIQDQAPDVLCLQETNGFEKNDGKLLIEVGKTISLPYFELSPSAKFAFHVATFSRYRFSKVKKIKLLQNACLVTEFNKTPLGKITLANAHPYPGNESERLKDIQVVLKEIAGQNNIILTGDMNSLSPQDKYPHDLAEKFNDHNRAKFTQNGQLAYLCIQLILDKGLVDVAVSLEQNHLATCPTGVDLHESFTITFNQPAVRLDYVFVSPSLKPHVNNYQVLINDRTRLASDHFPVTVVLS